LTTFELKDSGRLCGGVLLTASVKLAAGSIGVEVRSAAMGNMGFGLS